MLFDHNSNHRHSAFSNSNIVSIIAHVDGRWAVRNGIVVLYPRMSTRGKTRQEKCPHVCVPVMDVRMYVCVYGCMCVCMYGWVDIYGYAWMHVYEVHSWV